MNNDERFNKYLGGICPPEEVGEELQPYQSETLDGSGQPADDEQPDQRPVEQHDDEPQRPIGEENDPDDLFENDGELMTLDEVARAQGYDGVANLPQDHPLKTADAEDFATNSQIEAAQAYTPDPGRAAADAYNRFRGQAMSDGQINSQLDSMSLESLYELKNQCSQRGYPNGINMMSMGLAVARAEMENR